MRRLLGHSATNTNNTRFPICSFIRRASVVLLLGTLFACQGENKTSEPVSAPIRPVKVLEVNSANSGLQRVLAATVISADSQSLSFRVGGSITSLPVNVGDRVTAGATVAELDQQPYRLAEKEARAQLAQADANYRNSRSQYRRTRELYSTEAASLSDLENAKASASSARANLALAKEGLNSSRLNLGYSKLLSPSNSCQIVSVPVTVNQNVSAGQTVVTTACGDQLRLRTVVPENLINAIEPAMPVSATLQTGGAALSGNVVEIAVSSNNSTGYAVEIALNSPSPAVKVGMAAEVTFELTGTKERLVVPLIAVLSDSKGKFVFVAEPLNEHFQIARQTVTTGELSNDGIEIVEGIKTGQRVVVAGMSRITEGMTVSLYSGAKP